MSQLTSQQIRSTFIDFFKKNDHAHVPSSSLVPSNDPSLMFVNSGMVQFKDVFTGVEKRDYTKATSSQKSVRAGGKHNDLENVGYTARHHTFFEMLGNFSFGDYFKEQAIFYAWEMLTKHFDLPKEKLYVTVYKDDQESADIWKKLTGFSDDKIIKIATSDNFWSMGETGPCGPCTEIFYDHGDHIPGGLPGTPEEDGDRYIEIWNLVFMQYEQISKDKRILLPNQSVDTGMGLERISAVIQGVHDNYDTDSFQDIIKYTESILKIPATGDALFSYRVIADHLRSASFLIADGVMPSNEGRGYVLRRIMRRAMRHAHQLGAKEPLMYKLFPKLEELFKDPYTELTRSKEFVSSILQQEEERFKTTLDRGLKMLSEHSSSLKEGDELSGEVAFKLYDTYGFPVDLTEDILKKQQIKVNQDEFDSCMQEQKERARKSWSGSGDNKTDKLWFDLSGKIGTTEFLGYSLDSAEGRVQTLVSSGAVLKEITAKGEEFILIANQTPFYGESGGQMGDIGVIESADCKIKVTNTLKFLGKIIGHICVLESGNISAGDDIKLSIDTKYRSNLKMHHTATHILHAVLRHVLGKHVTQKGSLVARDKLRFDISHPKAITNEELKQIEDKINEIIRDNSEVVTNLMSTDEAIEKGAMALFGEKYDSEVRVVSLGKSTSATAEQENAYSFELCGGTHVSRTGDIGMLKITSESAIAAGVRRIEAVCGEFVMQEYNNNELLLEQMMDALKANKNELVVKLQNLMQSKKKLEAQIEQEQAKKLKLSAERIKEKAEALSGARLLYNRVDGVSPKAMRSALENIINQHDDLVVIFTAENDGKIAIIVGCSDGITGKYHAGKIAKDVSASLGGSGGGKPNLAQAGGTDLAALNNFSDKVKDIVSSI